MASSSAGLEGVLNDRRDNAEAAVALACANLAGLWQAQGRAAEAEPLLARCLAIREATLGPHDPSVAAACELLAGLYQA